MMSDLKTAQLFSRRALMISALGVAMSGPLGIFTADAKAQQSAQRIADHFSSVKSMAGEFVQFGPRGEQTGGKFFINRPGKLRFNYNAPSKVRVISDGKSVAVGNLKLKTWEFYPLSSTPLKLLLSEHIDLSKTKVISVTEDPDLTTIVLGDRNIFGDSTISMMFDPKTFELRQWTIRDAQGKDTSIMVYNVQTGLTFDKKVFTVPYDQARPKTTLR